MLNNSPVTCWTFETYRKKTVFCFVEGLKLWARNKLYEQKVQDLVFAFAAAKRLFETMVTKGPKRRM